NHYASAGEAHHRNGSAERQADQRGEHRRTKAYRKRQSDDIDELRIEMSDELRGEGKAVGKRRHWYIRCKFCRSTAILCNLYATRRAEVDIHTERLNRRQPSCRNTAGGGWRTVARVPIQPAI